MLEKLKQFKVGQVIKREPTGASVAFLGSFEEEKESKVVLALKKREFPRQSISKSAIPSQRH